MKGRVLVIEDDPDISLSIRTVLTRNGFDVASSGDGKEGLRAFHVKRPDLVVLDIGLPTLDGWAVLERIRDLSDVPILMLTAHGREADKVRTGVLSILHLRKMPTEMEVALATVYRYFNSKDYLLAAALEDWQKRLTRRILASRRGSPN